MDLQAIGVLIAHWVPPVLGVLATLGGIVWTAIEIHDRVVVRVRVKTHPGILYRRPQQFEDTLRRIMEEGGDPTKVFVVPAGGQHVMASAQGPRDVPRGALNERPAMFVRVYNYSPKRKINVLRVWYEGPNNIQVPVDGPAGPWVIPPETYRETWILMANIPRGVSKEQRYRSFRAQVLGRRTPVRSVMTDRNEVGVRGELTVQAAPDNDW